MLSSLSRVRLSLRPSVRPSVTSRALFYLGISWGNFPPLLYLISMLPSSPNSLGVRLNPTPGSPPHYEPSGPLFATLRTSGNALTLLLTGPPSSLCATSTTTSFSQPRNTSTLTASLYPLTTPSACGKL